MIHAVCASLTYGDMNHRKSFALRHFARFIVT